MFEQTEMGCDMTATMERVRDPGRPRQFSDEVVFRATAEAVAVNGYRGLTMAAVARNVGCTGPALIHRFGSKQALLMGYLEWSIARSEHLFSRVQNEAISPLEALRTRFTDPDHRHTHDDAAHAAHLVFFVEGRVDQAFVPHMERYAASVEGGIERLLTAAVCQGELRPLPTSALAHTLVAAIFGACLMWTPTHQTSIAEGVGMVIDTVIAPWRTCGQR
jgi:AcrR family transcriptional regulator